MNSPITDAEAGRANGPEEISPQAPKPVASVEYPHKATFEAISDWALTEYDALFRRLADA